MKKLLLGIVIGMLIAPKKGSELRADIKDGAVKTYNSIVDMDADDFKAKVSEIKQSISEFDLEKTKESISEKAEQVKSKVEDIISSEKVQRAVEAIKETTAKSVELAQDIRQKVVSRGSEKDTLSEEIEKELEMEANK